ncbi:MAG: chromate transporter [Myxococcales bacterium]|jgi:chromate transporter|nr:chromate transporter [Myxococcales bacterium]
MSDNGSTPQETTSLAELALLFLRLGATTFGGPAAHIAIMRDEVVQRRRWLTDERFLDLLGATSLIPGPNSTEMAIHIGWGRRRWAGLVVAGVSFIVPAMLITGALAWAYVRYDKLPQASWFLWGIKPVILAVVAQAFWNLAPAAARTWPLRVLAVGAATASALGVHELVILFGCGVLVAAATRAKAATGKTRLGQLVPVLPVAAGAMATSAVTVTLSGLFGVFFKIGSVLFGSGYVLVAFLRADLVQKLHWLTEAQLIDAVAAGQLTPGPVFTTATFVGYLLAGPGGALVATLGIFLPAFIFVALSGPLVPRIRASPLAGSFLDGVNVASLALMAVVASQLGRGVLVDLRAVILGAVSLAVLLRFRINATWLVLGGAAAGAGAHTVGWL